MYFNQNLELLQEYINNVESSENLLEEGKNADRKMGEIVKNPSLGSSGVRWGDLMTYLAKTFGASVREGAGSAKIVDFKSRDGKSTKSWTVHLDGNMVIQGALRNLKKVLVDAQLI